MFGYNELAKSIYNNIIISKFILYCNSVPCNRGRLQSSCIDARPPGGPVKWVQIQQAALVDVSFHTISPGKRRSAFSSAVILDDHFSDSLDATRRTGNMTMPPEPARPQDRSPGQVWQGAPPRGSYQTVSHRRSNGS